MIKNHFPLILLLLLSFSTHSINFDRAVDDNQGQYFTAYMQHMGNYVAFQTFSFDLAANSSFKLMIQKKPNDSKIRGMVFTETDFDNDLEIRMYQGDQLIQQLPKAKMGILFGHLADNGLIIIDFKNQGKQKTILFSYELVNQEKKKEHVYGKQFGDTISKYGQVSNDIRHSELLNEANIASLLATSKRIAAQQNQAYYYAIIETLILLTFYIISLVMLRKIIKTGYTSII